jgi:hypothetical protein
MLRRDDVEPFRFLFAGHLAARPAGALGIDVLRVWQEEPTKLRATRTRWSDRSHAPSRPITSSRCSDSRVLRKVGNIGESGFSAHRRDRLRGWAYRIRTLMCRFISLTSRPNSDLRDTAQTVAVSREDNLLGDAKAGNDIPVPLTPAIQDALRLAGDAAPDHKPADLIFPGCAQVGHREKLPTRGHALRRTFKTIATAYCKVPDDVSAFLLGHVPEGMSQKYLLRGALSSGPALHKIMIDGVTIAAATPSGVLRPGGHSDDRGRKRNPGHRFTWGFRYRERAESVHV